MYISNIRVPLKMKILTEVKIEIDNSTTLVSDFTTWVLPAHGNQKINKETEHLYNTVEWLYLTNMYRTFHSTTAEISSFSSTSWNLLHCTDHMLDYKTKLNKYMKVENIQSLSSKKKKSIFFNHSEMILEINSRRKTGKVSKSGK